MSNKEYSNRNKSYSSKDYHSNGNYSDKGCMTTIVLLFLVFVLGGWFVFSNSDKETIDKYFDSFQDKKEDKKVTTPVTVKLPPLETNTNTTSSKTGVTTGVTTELNNIKKQKPYTIFNSNRLAHKDIGHQIEKKEPIKSENKTNKNQEKELEEKIRRLSSEYRERLLDYNHLDPNKQSEIKEEFKKYEKEYRSEISKTVNELNKLRRQRASVPSNNEKTAFGSSSNRSESALIDEMKTSANNLRKEFVGKHSKFNSLSDDRLLEEYEVCRTIVQEKIKKYGHDRKNIFSDLLNFENVQFVSIAISKDYPRLLEVLINNGYPIENHYFNGLPVIFHVNEYNKPKCLEILLKHNIDLTRELVNKRFLPNRVYNPELEVEGWFNGKNLLHSAAQTGNLTLAQKVLEAGVSINKRTEAGKSPLYFAVKYNQPEMVAFLVEKGIEIDKDYEDLTNNQEILDILKKDRNSSSNTDSGDTLSKEDKEWKEAYEYIKEGKLVKIYELSKKKDLAKMRYKGEPAICIAVQYNKIEIIKYLVHEFECEKQVNINNNRNALHYAVINTNIEIIKFLLENGFNPNVQDKTLNTPLHYAMNEKTSSYIALKLLEKGANPNLANSKKQTALHLAVLKEDSEIIKLLLQYGADMNIADFEGNTALHYVALFDSTNTEILKQKKKYKDKFNLSIKNNDGKTPNDINEAFSFEAP